MSIALENDKDSQSSDFFKSSYALVFFGVPNLGLRQGKLKEITAEQLNAQLIHDLELDTESEPTPYLRALKDKFIRCCKGQEPPFRIVSYYERKETPIVVVCRAPTLVTVRRSLLMVRLYRWKTANYHGEVNSCSW